MAPEPGSISQGTVLTMHGRDDTTGARVVLLLIVGLNFDSGACLTIDTVYPPTHPPTHPTARNIEYRVRGTYPKVRFLSFQTYGFPAEQPVGHIADFEIEPCPGSVNPFRDFSWGPGDTGRYEIFITATGRKGVLCVCVHWCFSQ